MDTTLEAKDYSPAQAEQALVRALRGRKGQLTQADAVTASGLPTHLAEEALERMLKRYRSHLAVTEDGQLLYAFDPALERRDAVAFRERLLAFARLAARVGMWLFKALIAVTLVAYVVAFVVLILGALMAGGSRDDRRRDDRGLDVAWIWWLFWPSPGWGQSYDAWGRPYGAAPRPRRGRAGKKPFLQSVFDFVFGPAQPSPDRLVDEREVLAYLRAHDGRITATDLVALFGLPYRRAEEEATRLLCDYDGTPEITDEGVLVYAFPALLKSAAETTGQSSRWRMAWERLEERPRLSGNSSGMDLVVGGFAAFNLIASLFAGEWLERRYGFTSSTGHFWLTAFPLAFFAVFLAIPAGRALARWVGDRGRARRNGFRKDVRRILEAGGKPLPDGPEMKALALALEGEPDLVDEAVVWRFPRVKEETEARERYIKGRDLARERALGPVIFDSEEPVH